MTIPDDVPLSYPDLPIADRPVPSRLDRLLAGQEANDIAADINRTHDALRRSLVDELWQAIGPDMDPGDGDGLLRPVWTDRRSQERLLTALDRVRQIRSTSGGRTPALEGLPTSREEFESWFRTRVRDEYDIHREILDNAPARSWGPELTGSIWSELTDVGNVAAAVATAPLGGANVARVALVEGAAGALTEAAQFERRSLAAERLMLPAPNLAENLMWGALGGAVLGGAFQAGANALTGRSILTGEAARAAQVAEAPPGLRPLETENAITDAALALANDPVLDRQFGIRTNPAMNPLLTLDGRQSAMVRPEAGDNMQALLTGPFARMQEIFGAEVTINDAIARAGTSRERETPGSQHFGGNALDLDISGMSNEDRLRLVNAAIEAGFTGFGFGNGILHVDVGPRRSWAYGNATFAGRPISEMAQLVASGQPAEPDWDDIARRIIGVESGGNPTAANPNSSATGLGQFIDSTWLAMIERHRPDLLEGRTRAQVLALRTDPALSMEMTVAYTRDNAAALDAAGFPPTPGNLYLAHFAGVQGAIAALRAPRDAPILTVMSRAAIAANAPIRYQGRSFADFTVAHLIGWARSRMGDTGAAAGAGRPVGGAGAGTSGGAASGVWAPTSRGYTTTGQITTGARTIDVEYEVVDAALLRTASGALQPRDRTRAASAEQIAEMAARLDPARLMPAPEADRGAPIVGPDGIIESGNGRVAAIREAAARFPDRIAAYRSAIRAAGFDVPDDIEVPVLVARRRSELSDADRQLFVREANSATVARLSASERAAMDAAMIDDATMARFDPGAALDTPENAGFLRAALARLPQAERNALVTPEGRLNREGRERMNRAIFARAFDDRGLLERLAEEQPGELRSLLEALEQAAPSWAALRNDIAAGRVAPEFDIGGHVIEAVRIIAAARDIARTSGKQVSAIVEELLADNDLLEGLLSPLTQALVRKFYPGGRVLPADKVADFLRRYADEARRIGQGGGLLDAPGPLDALRAIDPETFSGLTETGTPRGAQSPVAMPANPVPTGPAVRQADPDNARFIDTRNLGRRFHGSVGDIAELDEFTYSFGNFYGQGFYTTDAVAIANGYSRGGKIYEIAETAAVRAFDMEQPAPDFLIAAVREQDRFGGDTADILNVAFLDDDGNPGTWTVREAFDRARSETDYPAEQIQDAFEVVTDTLRAQGFSAMDHTGGLRTKKAPHQVRIYLNPRDDIQLTEVDRGSFAPTSGMDTPQRSSDLRNRASSTSQDRSSPSTSMGATGPQTPAASGDSMMPGSGSTAGMEPSIMKNRMGDTSVPDVAVAPRLVNSTSAEDIAASGNLFDLDTANLRAGLGDMLDLEVTTIDGQTWTAAQLLDELDADIAAYRVLDTCMLGRAS